MLKYFLSILLFSLCAQAEDSALDFGARYFIQGINNNIEVEDDDNKGRKFRVDPSPPSQNGIDISYKGYGIGFAFSEEDEPDKLSRYRGVSYRVPYKDFLFEAGSTIIEGAEVTGRGFVDDVKTRSVNLSVSWSEDDYQFSWFFNLDDAASFQLKDTKKYTFYYLGYEDVKWQSNQAFYTATTGPMDLLGFHQLRRKTLSPGYGFALLKQWHKLRGGFVLNGGANVSRRKLSYLSQADEEDTYVGLHLSFGVSLLSGYGMQTLNEWTDIKWSYGINSLIRNNTDFSQTRVNTSHSAGKIFIGALW